MALTDERQVEINLVWGLNPQNRSICPQKSYDADNPCEGTTDWDEGFTMNDGDSQLALLVSVIIVNTFIGYESNSSN